MNRTLQAGFTLIELMVSLVLGLLISAAALQIFYLSSVSSNVQQAGSGLVDSNVFGLDAFLKEIRKAGLGAQPAAGTVNSPYYQNHLTPQGGIVLTAPTSPETDSTKPSFDLKSDTNLKGLLNGKNVIDASLLTTNASTKSGSNIKGVANSDQLTIQYRVATDNQVDCTSRNVKKDDYVIERYFLRNDDRYGLALACVAAIYTLDTTKLDKSPVEPMDISKYTKPDGTANTSNLAGNGEIIVPNIDYFRVLLGITDSKNFSTDPSKLNLQYIPIPSATQMATVLKDKRIVNIQVGILLRSTKSTKTATTRYKVLDKDNLELNDTIANDGKMRNVFETTILLRNARGTVR